MKKEVKAVILAGGKGTRLYPITYEIPKPLLPVKGKPIISHLTNLFLESGIKDIFVLISKDSKDDFYWWKKRYHPKENIDFIEENEPLGTFGGLLLVKEKLAGCDFFLTNGDELKKLDLKKMQEFHDSRQEIATIALVEVENPQDYGVVLCNSGRAKEFLEKPKNPPSKFINSGLYLLSSEIFKYHPGLKFCMIEKDIFPKLAQEGKLAAFQFQGKWTDCGTWERYEKAIKEWE